MFCPDTCFGWRQVSLSDWAGLSPSTEEVHHQVLRYVRHYSWAAITANQLSLGINVALQSVFCSIFAGVGLVFIVIQAKGSSLLFLLCFGMQPHSRHHKQRFFPKKNQHFRYFHIWKRLESTSWEVEAVAHF